MKVLVVSELGGAQAVETNVIPRVCDNVDMFYEPLPKVRKVILWPSKKKWEDVSIKEEFDAIVLVE